MFIQIDNSAAVIIGLSLLALALAIAMPESAAGAAVHEAITAVQSTAEGIA